ncbi:hypothetical protein Epa17_00151 [Pseudomonas phage Epa17]|uniref:Uncharacterized protein n=4 Tax=Nankokuvirus G1 TaxID=2560662 RepID=A0A6G9LEV2_9CAUD|nr:hypothetical protein Epa24_00006 [Pseudomonas phage Epa24]QIQ64135.1 hypothetical protein Epa17_00151 [Pseudomonas phage Epa17]QIQ65025.1 hypothetical protein 16_00070 [Pseudomonas phage Epa16]QIQ65659.1 hypothetical protein 26_00002 [Pseudomonas phage Epa26]
MKTYEASVLFDASLAGSLSVEANSVQEAIHLLEDKVGYHSPTLCYQCAGHLDLGDMTGMVVYCEDEEVADTTYAGEVIRTLNKKVKTLEEDLSKAYKLLSEIRPSIPQDVLKLWCEDRDTVLSGMRSVE